MSATNSYAANLAITSSAKIFALTGPLTAKVVRQAFKDTIDDLGARKVGAVDVRQKLVLANSTARYSWLCFSQEPPVTFLRLTKLAEKRYGYVLLIEHRNLLAVFVRGVTGVEGRLGDKVKLIPREKLLNLWGKSARYQALSGKRMALGHTELRGFRYEAHDLEMSMPPAGAGRSIPTTFQLAVPGDTTRGVTPSTGRVQKAGDRVGLPDLVRFVDEVADELTAAHRSPFLSAFSVPIELADLPAGVVPTGVLLDRTELDDALAEDSDLSLVHPTAALRDLDQHLSQVYLVASDPSNATRWKSQICNVEQVALKRLTYSFKLHADVLKGWEIKDAAANTAESLEKWFDRSSAFRVAFSDPEYFYTSGSLYRRANFQQDARLVEKFLHPQDFLAGVSSEKGDVDSYTPRTTQFHADSIFRRLETNVGQNFNHLVCSDLGDEWADYLGISQRDITFFHCKHGDVTAGASAFQEVTAQGQKNLGRIKLKPDDLVAKLDAFANQPLWQSTKGIPRLVRGTWAQAKGDAAIAVMDPTTTWKVVLVVSALSKSDYQAEMQKPTLAPHFIQLVWLLSSFIAICREREAQPEIWCQA